MNIYKKGFVFLAVLLSFTIAEKGFSKGITLEELEVISNDTNEQAEIAASSVSKTAKSVNKAKIASQKDSELEKNLVIYGPGSQNRDIDNKSLEILTRQYGLKYEKKQGKIDGSQPLTRDEAYTMLINLTSKIEKIVDLIDKTESSSADIATKKEIAELKKSLQNDTKKAAIRLQGKVDNLESNIDSLKSSVAKLSENNKFRIGALLQTRYTGNFENGRDLIMDDNYLNNFAIPIAEFRLMGRPTEHTIYMASMLPSRTWNDTTTTNTANGILGDVFIATDKIPKHTVYFGQSRTPIGQEGTVSPALTETIEKSQISRYYGDTRDFGLKASGNWKYVDYTFGVFNGNAQNTWDRNNGKLDIASWVNFKPLAFNENYGKLELGGGYYYGTNPPLKSTVDKVARANTALQANQTLISALTAASGGAVTSVPSTALGYASLDNTYTQRTLSLYGSYKYKNWGIRGEYGRKHGFLFADRPSNGFFTHISYDLTPKIQLVARFDNMAYDQFVALPSAQMVASILAGSSAFGFQKNTMREFTLGANYFIKGETLKVQTNYVHIYNKLFRDSDRFSVQTQYFVF